MDRLRNFLLVVEKGSIAAAADREPSRQSLLSRQIRELEAFFEVELTRRSGKTIEITEPGQQLAGIVRRCFSELQDYQSQQKGIKPLLRVGAGFSTMQWILTPHTGELSQILHSDLEMIRMRSRDAKELLRKGNVDFVVVRKNALDETDKNLVIFPIGGCGYSLFSPKTSELPMAVPTGGGQYEMVLINAIVATHTERIRCASLLQMSSLVAAEQASAVLPDIARSAFQRMDWVHVSKFPPLSGYRREWVVAANKRQLETRGISGRQLKLVANLLKIS